MRQRKDRQVKNKNAIAGINLKSLADELMRPYFDECRACLADGIVADRDIVDAGMVFGTGFAPFRGGPLYYLDHLAQTASGLDHGNADEEQNHVN